MESHRAWTTVTLCWFFAVFNVERLFPQVNIASFVYGLATIAGLSMLVLPFLRRQRFAVAAVGFGIIWIFSRCLLGYEVDQAALPLALAEICILVGSQYLCLKVAQNSDEFALTSTQLLEVLRANSVPSLREMEGAFLDEIRRARRHERPLTFVSLTPGKVTSDALSELTQQLKDSLSREYVVGCLSRVLRGATKSHDLTVRVGDQFLMLLPETDADQARAMSQRIKTDMFRQLGLTVDTDTYAFGIDEVTLSGVLDRLGMQPLDRVAPQSDVFQIRPSKTAVGSQAATTANAS